MYHDMDSNDLDHNQHRVDILDEKNVYDTRGTYRRYTSAAKRAEKRGYKRSGTYGTSRGRSVLRTTSQTDEAIPNTQTAKVTEKIRVRNV